MDFAWRWGHRSRSSAQRFRRLVLRPLRVKFRDGTMVPALGQGSANLAQGRYPEGAEEEALRTGLSLGMTLIDTAEMYGNGRSEKLIGGVIAGQRDRVFLVSKVSPKSRDRRRYRAGLRGEPRPSRHRLSPIGVPPVACSNNAVFSGRCDRQTVPPAVTILGLRQP